MNNERRRCNWRLSYYCCLDDVRATTKATVGDGATPCNGEDNVCPTISDAARANGPKVCAPR